MAELYYPPTQNAIQKTLDAALLTGVTASVTLNNITGIQNKKGVFVVDRIDANGVSTPSKREYVSFAGTSGVTLTTLVRGLAGSSDQDHTVGAIVEFIPDIVWAQEINDVITAEHTTGGVHTAASTTAAGTVELATTAETTTGTATTLAVTPDGLHDMTSLSGAAWLKDEDDMASDSATTVPSQQSVKAYVTSGTVAMTNKAVTKRVVTTTDDATSVINCTTTDVYELTAVANNTEFTITGTPTDGQPLIIRYKDAGVAKNLTFTGFTAIGVTIPTVTTAGKWGYVGAVYNLGATTWHVIAVQTEA